MKFELIKPLFNGNFSAGQLEGLTTILETCGDIDKRHTAYIISTIYHETGRKMQPVKEYGSKAYLSSKPYYPYYGRDLVQTTWIHNYQKVKDFIGIDVVTNPDLIGQMPLAAQVAVTFMQKGWYTGRKLSDYFNDEKNDPFNARRIINGIDCAERIKDYYYIIYNALL